MARIYCARHYAEVLKPRCAACDELIFTGEYTRAMNANWHVDHFACHLCSVTLTGKRYVLRDDSPICMQCYESTFANTCSECERAIGVDTKDLAYKDRHWHEHCFLCSVCRMSLVDKPFGTKNTKIYCGNCYDQSFGERCCQCEEVFKAGTKKLEYKERQWHDKCFCCAACQRPIGTGSFVPKDDEIYCARCYENRFALRCQACQGAITVGGISYKQTPYHRDCFVCAQCNATLAGQKFSMKDARPYCAACYVRHFAKRCQACGQAIVSVQAGQPTKYISYEGRSWHNECFNCDTCSGSLVGRGFITDDAGKASSGDDEDTMLFICADCAKSRFNYGSSATTTTTHASAEKRAAK